MNDIPLDSSPPVQPIDEEQIPIEHEFAKKCREDLDSFKNTKGWKFKNASLTKSAKWGLVFRIDFDLPENLPSSDFVNRAICWQPPDGGMQYIFAFGQNLSSSATPHQTHEFDYLDSWNLMSDSELKHRGSDEDIAVLQRIVSMLGDQSQTATTITRDNFVVVVREMHQIKKGGTRLFGRAYMEARHFLETQEPIKAKKVYQTFLSKCNSPFFCEMAKSRLNSIP